MVKSSTFTLFVAIAALSPSSMASAQTREVFGPVLPMIYDAQGGRHYCLYGYTRPFDPPTTSRSDDDIIVCRNGASLTSRVQHRQFSSPGARARAEAPK
jgi:hypothetical protein